MRRVRAVGVLFAALTAGFCLPGCGGKPKPPDYAPPAPEPTPVAKADPTPPPKPADPEPKPPATPPTPKFNEPGLVALAPMPTPVPKVAPAGPESVVPMPTPAQPPPAPPAPTDPAPKEKPKTEFEWPLSVNGLPLSEYIKETTDLDPAKRQMALQAIPQFGPAARTTAIQAVLARMDSSKEGDPGVRATAFETAGALALFGKEPGFEDEADTREVIRILTLAAEKGGQTRLHAIQMLANFGPKAESSISYLVGQNMTTLEPAYETRKAVATTLGQIAFNEKTGPSQRALHCLTDVLIKDRSAAVRLAAYQSLVMLGPPYLPPPAGGGDKPKMVVDAKAVEGYVAKIKARLVPWKPVPGKPNQLPPTNGLLEEDKQVEIFARLALMRLDPKNEYEANKANLNAIAAYAVAPGTDTGPKVMALQALAAMGTFSAPKINDVVRALSDENPNVATAAVSTLVAMGHEGKPAIDALEKLKTRGSKKDEKDPKDYPVEYWEKYATEAIKAIKEAKPPLPTQ